MRFTIFILAGLFCSTTGTPTIKKGKFIVKFKPNVSQKQFLELAHSFNQNSLITQAKVKYAYPEKFYNGIAGEFSAEFLENLQANYKNDIEYIEEDGLMHANGEQDKPLGWGLSRISSRDLDLTKPYTYYDSAGAGVDVWVIDTGIQYTHSDFGGRAKLAKSFIGEGQPADGNGHGTHCAGIVGSTTYGIAKKANILGVQVLNSQGSGTYSDVVAGINYIAENVRIGKTVMNMSLGGPKSQAVDNAIAAAIKAGVVVVVASGGESQDACKVSPAGAPGVLAVGASDNSDKKASFSNMGKCVGTFAPGVDIISLWIGEDGATKKTSGTSMASAHVSGVAALYMAEKSYTSAQAVYDDLKNSATKDKLTGLNNDSSNRLLYNAIDSKSKEPADSVKKICKILPVLPFCKDSDNSSDDFCKLLPILCEAEEDLCKIFLNFCNEKK